MAQYTSHLHTTRWLVISFFMQPRFVGCSSLLNGLTGTVSEPTNHLKRFIRGLTRGDTHEGSDRHRWGGLARRLVCRACQCRAQQSVTYRNGSTRSVLQSASCEEVLGRPL